MTRDVIKLFIPVEVKKEPKAATVKKEEKNDSDSEDEGKKERQRFKSERPKEQKHEPSMYDVYFSLS